VLGDQFGRQDTNKKSKDQQSNQHKKQTAM
jgi:hypothetical protein